MHIEKCSCEYLLCTCTTVTRQLKSLKFQDKENYFKTHAAVIRLPYLL